MMNGNNKGVLLYTDAKTNRKKLVPGYRIYAIDENFDENYGECAKIFLTDSLMKDSLEVVITKETILELYEQFK